MRLHCFLLLGIGTISVHAAVDFARDIQPLFAEHCLECHGPDKAKGGLLLTSREASMKKLKSGAQGIIPGDASHSAIIQRLLSTDPDEHMPPKGKKPLKPDEIQRLKEWIAADAKFDHHWAYKPLARSLAPAGPATAGSANDIDRFVRARLAGRNLIPSPAADRVTLIKRAHYDLLGIPPSPEDVDAFVKDASPNAFDALLTRLLDNPHFGERWGRHWLDAARYADSDGYEKDRPRPDAWRYRDWVIRAINDDMPYDQFTIEQLAGDLLPDATPEQIVATAFNRQTLTNTEGGTDQEQFRVEAVFDRTETLGSVWLGLTVGCARCHSHKYDQLSQAEYYQLFAFFDNGDEVVRQVPVSPAQWSDYQRVHGAAASRLAALQRNVEQAKNRLPHKLPAWESGVQKRLSQARQSKLAQAFKPLAISSTRTESGTVLTKQSDQSLLASAKNPKTDTYHLEARSDGVVTALRLEVLPDESLPGKGPGLHKNGNFVLSELTLKAGGHIIPLHSAAADYTQPKGFDPMDVLVGTANKGWAVGGSTGKAHQLTVQLSAPLPAGTPFTISLGQHYTAQPGHLIGRFRISTASEETEASIVPVAVLRALNEEPLRRNAVVNQALVDYFALIDPAVMSATQTLNEAAASLPKAPLMDVRVIAPRTQSPRVTHVLHRGNFLDPADAVRPGTPGVLPPLAITAGQSATRLDLARWLVSADNPLPARVAVNQIWAHLFGEGLVKTVGDFGVRGEPPIHAGLLDHLAGKFIEFGWSRKKLLRYIMTSATYQQSSAQPAAGAAILDIDPKNEWLWRQNRLRVEGEIVRDLYLAASGLLSPKIGGPSVFPPMPPDVADLSYASNFKWTASTGEDRYRRGLYTFFKRTAPHPDLTTFDCPDANLANIKRTVSNTPLQALTTLNAEAFAEAAQALAHRVLTESSGPDARRLSRCFRLCMAREPSAREVDALEKLLLESRAYYATRDEEARAMTGSFTIKNLPPSESAAWTATARIVLNMDEFITRE